MGAAADDDFTIVARYRAKYAGPVQYYLLAQDVFRLGPSPLDHGDLAFGLICTPIPTTLTWPKRAAVDRTTPTQRP